MAINKFFNNNVPRVLSGLGKKEASLRFLDRTDVDTLSLRTIRFAIELAEELDDDKRVRHYADIALRNYPSNSLGYLVCAEYLRKNGQLAEAEIILKKGPKSKARSVALTKVYQYENDKKKETSTAFSNTDEIFEFYYEKDSLEGAQKAIDQIKSELQAQAFKAKGISWRFYGLQANLLLISKQYSKACQLLEYMPKIIKRPLGFYLLLVDSYKEGRNHHMALKTLLLAQTVYPDDHRILLRISDSYRDNGRMEVAYIYLKAAQKCNPKFGTVRRLAFETEMQLDGAEESFEEISKFTSFELMKFLPSINRSSVHFLGDPSIIAGWRESARRSLRDHPLRDPSHFNKMVSLAIESRWLSDAKDLLSQAQSNGLMALPRINNWIRQTELRLGKVTEILEIAYHNEQYEELIGLLDGVPVIVHTAQIDRSKIVELFIANAFFSEPSRQKDTGETIFSFMGIVYSYLLDRRDVLIIPRHQYNVRKVVRRMSARGISYHTCSSLDPTWLHIAATPLANRCSLDHQGYAGYASIASNFDAIDAATRNVDTQALVDNQQTMYDLYALGNVSKYSQNAKRKAITGDYVFIAMQVSTDPVASLAAVNGITLLRTVANHFRNSSTRVLVKRHPYCKSIDVQDTLEILSRDNLIEISDASVHDLIDGAKTVYAVNSGVGLEALIHVKPVVVTGQCDYAYAVAAQAGSLAELQQILGRNLSAPTERILKFLYFYTELYSISSSDHMEIQDRLEQWLDSDFPEEVLTCVNDTRDENSREFIN
ncbi:hypothetical protein H0A71_22545 [Alcaligenaceae bacterium]|nr:hypothetical protein [Alcaligenaceae bacterium]